MTIHTIHKYNEIHLAEIMAEAAKIGNVTVSAYVDGDTIFCLEGVHRVEAAKRLQLPLIIISCELNDAFKHDLQDVDTNATVADVYDYAYGSSLDGSTYSKHDFVSVEVR